MDNQKEEKLIHKFVATCRECNKHEVVTECVKCLALFCENCSSLSPRGNSCADCYPALHPEALFTTAYNFLTKVH